MKRISNHLLIKKLKKNNFQRNWHTLALLIICLIILISHTLYVFTTHQYPEQDEHMYLGFAVGFYDIFKNPTSDIYSEIIKVIPYRQPLYGMVLTIPLLLLGTAYAYKIALWVNVLFYIGSIIGIYFLAKEFLSKNASLLASFIFAFYGSTLFYLHFTYVETAVTTFIVFTLLFLAKSKYFSARKNTVLSASFFALGILARWVVPFFTGGAILVTFILGAINEIKKKKRNPKNFIINFLLFITISFILPFSIYYLPNLSYVSDYFSSQAKNSPLWIAQFFSPELQDLTNTFSTRSIMFYLNIFSQQTVFFWILFVAGFVISIKNFKKYIFLIAAFIFAYSSFTFASVLKFDRYIVPIYPLIAIISAVTFDHIWSLKFKRFLVLITIVVGLLNFLGASWAIGPMGKQGLKDIVLPEIIRHPRRIYLTPIVWPPKKEELNADAALSLIEKDFSYKKSLPRILITFEHHPYGNALYTIIVYEKRNKFSGINMRGIDFRILFEEISRSDYLLVKDGKPIDKEFMNINSEDYKLVKVTRAFNNVFENANANLLLPFSVIKKIPLPLDNSNIIIYKREGIITLESWQEFVNLLIEHNPDLRSEITDAWNKFSLTVKD